MCKAYAQSLVLRKKEKNVREARRGHPQESRKKTQSFHWFCYPHQPTSKSTVAINGGDDTGARPVSQTLGGTLAYLARRTMVLSIKSGANPHCVLLFCFYRNLDGVKRWHLPLFLRRAPSAYIEAHNPSVAPGLENPMLNFGPQRHGYRFRQNSYIPQQPLTVTCA